MSTTPSNPAPLCQPIIGCAICGKPCKYVDDNPAEDPPRGGWFCKPCGEFTETDVESRIDMNPPTPSAQTATAEEALADRIAATQAGWLPIAGHVATYTFTLAERDVAIKALRLTSSLAAAEARVRAATALMREIETDDHHGRYGRLAREAIAALSQTEEGR